jgi:hypothetical protein
VLKGILAEPARHLCVAVSGGRVVGTAVQIASSAGCYKVQLVSAKHRSPAHQLYQKTGFKPLAEGFRLYLEETC